ncbi:PAS domain-containing protein [Haloarcula sp. JP-Z28]|nr:ATP-binding protein [Haloarcula sp. JP-Z28]NHN63474.1 PAS domain-containing protein [Haloarcula sp. JP-Z28]
MSNNECGSPRPDIGTNEGLVVSASDGEIVETTGLVSRVTGYSKAELLAMPLSALFCAAGTDDSDKQVGTALSETDGRSYVVLECAGGTRTTVEQHSYTVRIGPQTYVCTTLRLPAAEPGSLTLPGKDAFRRLHKAAMESESVADTAQRLLTLGCDYLGADAGALARIDDATYTVEYTSSESAVYEPGQSMPLGETIASEVVTGAVTDPATFVVGEGQHSSLDAHGAYAGAPVAVGEDTYGVIEFTGLATREGAFGQSEREFVDFTAQWLGSKIEQERQSKRLERCEMALETVDEPAHALETDAVDDLLSHTRGTTASKQRARLFDSVFNQTYQFTALLEPDGTVIETNDATLEFGGFNRADMVGKPFAEAPWWSHSETVRDRVWDALKRAADGESARYETEVRDSQEVGTIDFTVKPVTNEDGCVNMLVVEGRDITKQSRHRDHLQVMQRVMRHHMRNDLTKLRGFTGALYTLPDSEAQSRYFERIEAILDKWTDMIEKTRQIGQVLEEQRHSQATTAVDELVAHATARADEFVAETRIRNDLPDGVTPHLPTVMREAVSELLGNAADATPDSNGQITVTLSQTADDWVGITVADNGFGLPDAEASVLRTGEETPLNHGQGIGLCMVRMIVKQVGGDVSVDVTQGGTEVTLHVPASESLRKRG